MALVYWIRKPDHTDIFTQGYVGVTSRTVEERFTEHVKKSKSKASKKSIIHKVINSIGSENLVADVVCICSEDYAYDLEFKLRPVEFVGWNQNIGGVKPPSARGRVMKDSTKKKIGMANSGPASPAKLEALKVNLFRPGHVRSELTKNKHSKTLEQNGPWNNPAANKYFWKNAEIFYEDFSSGLTIVDVKNKYNLTRNNLKTIFKHFTNGWVPLEDPRWVEEFKRENV